MNLFLFLFFIFSIISDSSGDALRQLKRQKRHHFFEAIQICIWLIIMLKCLDSEGLYHNSHAWFVILSYILLRFALFDIIYNLIAGNDLFYTGESYFLGKYISKMPVSLSPILKLIAITLAYDFMFNQTFFI